MSTLQYDHVTAQMQQSFQGQLEILNALCFKNVGAGTLGLYLCGDGPAYYGMCLACSSHARQLSNAHAQITSRTFPVESPMCVITSH